MEGTESRGTGNYTHLIIALVIGTVLEAVGALIYINDELQLPAAMIFLLTGICIDGLGLFMYMRGKIGQR